MPKYYFHFVRIRAMVVRPEISIGTEGAGMTSFDAIYPLLIVLEIMAR